MMGPSWHTVELMEQSRWRRFAIEHAGESERCAVIGAQPAISKADAVELAAIARDAGWSLSTAGRYQRRGRSRRRR